MWIALQFTAVEHYPISWFLILLDIYILTDLFVHTVIYLYYIIFIFIFQCFSISVFQYFSIYRAIRPTLIYFVPTCTLPYPYPILSPDTYICRSIHVWMFIWLSTYKLARPNTLIFTFPQACTNSGAICLTYPLRWSVIYFVYLDHYAKGPYVLIMRPQC